MCIRYALKGSFPAEKVSTGAKGATCSSLRHGRVQEQTELGRITDRLPKYDFDAPVVVVVDAKILDKKDIKRFLTPAGAAVANCIIPSESIHSVILKATGLMIREGPAYVDPLKKGITLTPRAQVMEEARGETRLAALSKTPRRKCS